MELNAYRSAGSAFYPLISAGAAATVAAALSQGQQEQLVAKLEQVTGKTVLVSTRIDKSILGGIVVKLGDKPIDGSVIRRMQSLQKQLMAN